MHLSALSPLIYLTVFMKRIEEKKKALYDPDCTLSMIDFFYTWTSCPVCQISVSGYSFSPVVCSQNMAAEHMEKRTETQCFDIFLESCTSQIRLFCNLFAQSLISFIRSFKDHFIVPVKC